MRKIFWILLALPIWVTAQVDLLKDIDTSTDNSEVAYAFKSLKIINLESTKVAAKGDFYFIVAHRFGYLNRGFEDFFGLDNAFTQIKFTYGVTESITLHVARSTYQKTWDIAGKYVIAKQKNEGFPFAITGFSSVAVNTALKKEDFPKLTFQNRLSYVQQLLISRKFSEKFSFQLAPSVFHFNTLPDIISENGDVILPNPQENTQYALGLGARYKLTNRLALNFDYALHANRVKESAFKNPLAIGLDIETGGHVFQLHFTNARAMHEAGFLGQTTGDFFKGDIAFGFNLVRVF